MVSAIRGVLNQHRDGVKPARQAAFGFTFPCWFCPVKMCVFSFIFVSFAVWHHLFHEFIVGFDFLIICFKLTGVWLARMGTRRHLNNFPSGASLSFTRIPITLARAKQIQQLKRLVFLIDVFSVSWKYFKATSEL